jgi:hypothetical protein
MVFKTLRHVSLAIAIATPGWGLWAIDSARAVEREFTVTNLSNLDILKIYISPTNKQSIDRNVLGQSILASGNATKVQITNDNPICYHHLQAIFSNGQVWKSNTLNLCYLNSYTFTN